MANRVISYFREAREELKKVVWPSRKQTTSDTILVIAISLFVALFLGAIDFVLSNVLQRVVS